MKVEVPTACYVTETALQLMPQTPRRGTRPMVSKAVRDATELQQLMMNDARDPKTGPAVRATIARSWALLQDCIRVMRGIPSPGQLRPDLDPVQLAKALKRSHSRSRKPLDIASSINGAASSSARMVDDEPAAEMPEPAEPETKAQPPTTTPTPERGYVPSPIPEKGKDQKHARAKEIDTHPADPLQQTKTPAEATTSKESLSTEGP